MKRPLALRLPLTSARAPVRYRLGACGIVLLMTACQDAPPLGSDGSPRQMAAAPTKSKAQSIVSGAAAPNDSAIFFLEVTTPSGVATCSATLVTPDLLLTAAHCVTGQFGAVDCERTRLAPPLALDSFRVSNEPNLTGAPQDDWLFPALSDVRVVFEGQPLCGHDIALLQLEEPLPPSVAQTLDVPQDGLDDAATTPATYRAVGYGAVHPSGTGERVRRTSSELEVACDSPSVCESFVIPGAAGAMSAAPPSIEDREWIGAGSGCPGDSGGPALMDTSAGQGVIGVLSRGRSDCSLNIYTSPQSAELRRVARELMASDTSEPRYQIPLWAREPPPPEPTTPQGGMGGTLVELPEDPPEMGGSLIESPDEHDGPQPTTKEDSGCSCRASGPSGGDSRTPAILSITFLFLWWARRRPTGARAKLHR